MKRISAFCGIAASVAMMAAPALAGGVVVDGSTTVGPIAKAFAEYYMTRHPDVNITVSESGSGNGAKSLINGACDVATLSRKMKAEELEAAAAKKVNPVEHVVAMDGIAMIVHPGNSVEALALEQIRAIYMGEIRNWKALGGPDEKIVIISRDTNSGTYETFQNMVMKSERVSDKAEYVGSNGAIRQRVMSTAGAIGYVGLAFLEGVKALSVNEVEPAVETVLDHSYPISRPLFMYTNGELKEGSDAAAFVGLYKTEDGKKIISEQGFVPMP